MKRRKVIARKNLPARFPLISCMTIWLFLDRFDAPGWVHGIVWTLLSVIAIATLVEIATDDEIDVFNRRP